MFDFCIAKKTTSAALIIFFGLLPVAAAVNLADSPVANLTGTKVKPNIMFIFDDSGSMAFYELPDSLYDKRSKYAYKNAACNSLFYDPARTYELPIKSDGTAYPTPTFISAWVNGFDTSAGTVNLNTSFQAWKNVSGTSHNDDSDTAQQAYYYKRNSSNNPSTLGTSYPATCYVDTAYTKVNVTNSSAEKNNFAIWFSYYRQRHLAMKSSVGRAFKSLDDGYRVGFNTINQTVADESTKEFLNIKDFGGQHKIDWYDQLYGVTPSGGTPLRPALSRAGNLYAGTLSGATDPVQYSCQQNFAILSTDGYWNQASQKGYQIDGSTAVGDQDGTAVRPFYDKTQTLNTLADIAYYYYVTDLRSGTGWDDNVPPAGTDAVVDDVASWQHMTTFTIGFGLSGKLNYINNYKYASTGDYRSIYTGSKDWPVYSSANEGNDVPEKIDDLWHAAVNGRGIYISAKTANDVEDGLMSAFKNMGIKTGAGAAAATSNLEPISGDDKIFVGEYTTGTWSGNINSYTLNLGDGSLSSTPNWDAATLLNARTYSGRDIFTYASSKKIGFNWADISKISTLESDFNNKIKLLSQYDAADTNVWPSGITGESLVTFLAGDRSYELNSSDVNKRRFRQRVSVFGDIVNSQPVYVGKSPFSFTNGEFSSRTPYLYVAANDGMLHAFEAATGIEKWAYIPPMVLGEIWQLADINYNHKYFVDGAPVVSDIKPASQWKTILVAGLNKGGKGYYALDVTSPASPDILWNYSNANDAGMGYSYGKPVIAKIGTDWVVIISSGYNGSGNDKLIILNADTGVKIKEFSTGSKNGIASFSVWSDSFSKDPTAIYAYAGDLAGNMWRFDLGAADGTAPLLLAATGKPITTKPELAEIDGKRIVYFGTGKFLDSTDLADTSVQSFYGIKDADVTVSVSSLEPRTLTSVSTSKRKVSGGNINWATSNGWYFDFNLTTGERVNVDPMIQLGTLAIVTNIPGGSACQAGGTSWLYFLDFEDGTSSTGGTSSSDTSVFISNSLSVGFNMLKLPSGEVKTIITTADNKHPVFGTPVTGASGGGRRVSWREIVTD